MPNIGDLGESLCYARKVLGPRVTEPALFSPPRAGLGELVEDIPADALTDLPFGALLDEIELLGIYLQRSGFPAAWIPQLRDVLRATTRVVRPSLGYPAPERAATARRQAPRFWEKNDYSVVFDPDFASRVAVTGGDAAGPHRAESSPPRTGHAA